MTDLIKQLIVKYRSKGILVDTNILLLWFVGATNRARIAKFARTQTYIPQDYDTLLQFFSYFPKVVTTPNILTEVYNLINQIGEPDRSRCLDIFAQNVTRLDEFFIESSLASQADKFTIFGLTDSGIVTISRDKYLVLTDDFRLASYLQKIGIETVNFNNIRELGW